MESIPILVTAIVTAIISLSAGLIRTKQVDDNLFVKPAMRAIRMIKNDLNKTVIDKCPDCNKEFVEPYVQISMRRIQLVVALTPIFFALITQSILLNFVYDNWTAALSNFIWSLIPGTLVGHYILELKDVFDWWKSPHFRNAIALTSISIGAVNATNPFLFNIVGWIVNPQPISVDFLVIWSANLFYACLGLFIGAIIVRYFLNRLRPSLKTRITRHLTRNPDGYTLDGWVNYLDPEQELPPAKARLAILDTLRELVYQGNMKISVANRSSEPVYLAID